jgi:hypothetical protein
MYVYIIFIMVQLNTKKISQQVPQAADYTLYGAVDTKGVFLINRPPFLQQFDSGK